MSSSPRLRWSTNINDLLRQSHFQARTRQAKRIGERRKSTLSSISLFGKTLEIFPGVYDTSADTELMTKAVRITPAQTFLEVGIGCGAVSLVLAKKSHRGLGVDINPRAVKNAQRNQRLLRVKNISFRHGNVFRGIRETFDVILCNPPYSPWRAKDSIDRMFWDTNDGMKKRFFRDVRRYLNPKGRVYFGWADFADINTRQMMRWASSGGLRYSRHVSAQGRTSPFRFFVIEFERVP